MSDNTATTYVVLRIKANLQNRLCIFEKIVDGSVAIHNSRGIKSKPSQKWTSHFTTKPDGAFCFSVKRYKLRNIKLQIRKHILKTVLHYAKYQPVPTEPAKSCAMGWLLLIRVPSIKRNWRENLFGSWLGANHLWLLLRIF